MQWIIPEELGHVWVRLELRYPSFASYVMQYPIPFEMVDDPTFTACCTPTCIKVGHQWLAANTDDVQVAGVLHELLHHMFGDCQWLKSVSEAGFVGKYPFDNQIAQHAMDYRNNDCLLSFGAELGPGWLWDNNIGKMTEAIEVIYYRLYEQKEGGGGGRSPGPNAGGDVEPGDEPEDETDEMRRRMLAEKCASEVCTQRGVDPGDAKSMIGRINPTRIKWTALIKPTLKHVLGRGVKTWARPNNYTLPLKLILPGDIGKKAGFLCVVRDTSGSVIVPELGVAYSGLREILHFCIPEKMLAIDCDARVQAHYWLAGPGALKPDVFETAKGRGGTSMPRAFEWLKEQGLAPDVVVVVTDMETDFPADMSPAKEVIWVNVRKNGIEAPKEAGRTVFLP